MDIKIFLYKNKSYSFFFLTFFLTILFYIFWAGISDITIDETSYVYMYRDSGQNVISYIIDYIKKADHFPLCFSVKLFFFEIFDNIIPLRLFSILCGVLIFSVIFKICINKGMSLRNSLIFIILFVLNPLVFYHTIYFTYYFSAFFFLVLSFYYYEIRSKYKISFFFLLLAIASHYFSIFFLGIFILKRYEIKKNWIIYFLLLLIIISGFIKFDKNFNVLDSGESGFISVQDTKNPELDFNVTLIFKSIGNSMLFPGMYSPYTLKYTKNHIVSLFSFMCIIFIIVKNKTNFFVYSVPLFFLCFVIISYYVKIRYGLLIFAPARLFFVSLFSVISIIYFFIKMNKYRIFLGLLMIIIYSAGYLYIYQNSFEIQKTAEFIEKNKIKYISLAKEFDGKFDFRNMIDYYIKDNYKDNSEKKYFLVLKHGDFHIDKAGFQTSLEYDSQLFQIYSLFPKKSLLK